MKLNDGLQVKCKKCGATFEMEIEMECTSTDDRNMGTEYGYEGVFDGECPKCGAEVLAHLEVYEYPEGILNYANEITDGVDILQKPDYVIEDV